MIYRWLIHIQPEEKRSLLSVKWKECSVFSNEVQEQSPRCINNSVNFSSQKTRHDISCRIPGRYFQANTCTTFSKWLGIFQKCNRPQVNINKRTLISIIYRASDTKYTNASRPRQFKQKIPCYSLNNFRDKFRVINERSLANQCVESMRMRGTL